MAKAPRGWRTLTPRLVVADVAGEVRFLKRVFRAVAIPSPGPSVLQIGDSRLMVSELDPRPATESLLYVYVDDVDATYGRAVKAGARTIEAPAEMPYGDRRAMVEDPSGTTWQIASSQGSPGSRGSRGSRGSGVRRVPPRGRSRGRRS